MMVEDDHIDGFPFISAMIILSPKCFNTWLVMYGKLYGSQFFSPMTKRI